MRKRLAIVVVALGVVATACSSQPETCDEAADETIELMQDLIDEVEAEFEDMEINDFLDLMATNEDLPSVVSFQEKAEKLSERMAELGCSEEQLTEAVSARSHQLEATTPLGEFLIWGIENGGL